MVTPLESSSNDRKRPDDSSAGTTPIPPVSADPAVFDRDAALPSAATFRDIEWRIDNRVNATAAELATMQVILNQARHAMDTASAPLLSGFNVGAALATAKGEIASGANFEHGAGPGRGLDDATHGEQSAVANMLLRYGADSRVAIIGYTTRLPEGIFACSCGRCRGIIESFAEPGKDVLLVSGSAHGSATTWTLSELLPDDFRELPADSLSADSAKLLTVACEMTGRSIDVFTKPVTGPTGAAVLTDDGAVHNGARFDVAAFYGLSAVGGALQSALAANDFKIAQVCVVSGSGRVLPEDRQFIYEFASALGRADSMQVLMFSSDTNTLRVATPKELLPFGFGAPDLGGHIVQALRTRFEG